MAESKSTWNLIAIPALITLAVTILRLVGELRHWPTPWFSNAAGGGGAVVGISWLPVIFGPWFAVKLMGAGDAPASKGKAVGFAVLSVAVLFGAGFWFESQVRHLTLLAFVPMLLMLGSAFIPGIGWRSLGKTLLAYAFAARLPILIVMFLAMRGNGGAGWGTHYDAIAPMFAQFSFARRYVYEALLPQMTLWIGWTVAFGALFGAITAAVVGRAKPAPQAAS